VSAVTGDFALKLNLGLGLSLVLLALVSLGVGRVPVDWVAALFDPALRGTGWIIITELRLPRTLLAVLVGGGLGLSGAVMQGYLRNPLADPGLLGVSSFASLGAVIALYFGLSAMLIFALPLMAVGFAALGMGLLYMLAGRTGGTITFVLAGVILSSLSGGLVSLALTLAPNPFAMAEITNWLIGSFTDRSFNDVWLALPLIGVGGLFLLGTGRALDGLTLGEDTARSLGANLGQLRLVVIGGVGLVIGGAVTVSGVIGFVGLVVPHLVRPLVGGRPSATLLPSALAGAALTLAADIAVRALAGQQEIKLGIVMTLLGAPFFLLLLWRLRRGRA
jgi:iron complex transport system permease protein